MKSHLQSYPCPLQINSFWNLGFLLGITIILQIITGIFLGLHYTSDLNSAYSSVFFFLLSHNILKHWIIKAYVKVLSLSLQHLHFYFLRRSSFIINPSPTVFIGFALVFCIIGKITAGIIVFSLELHLLAVSKHLVKRNTKGNVKYESRGRGDYPKDPWRRRWSRH